MASTTLVSPADTTRFESVAAVVEAAACDLSTFDAWLPDCRSVLHSRDNCPTVAAGNTLQPEPVTHCLLGTVDYCKDCSYSDPTGICNLLDTAEGVMYQARRAEERTEAYERRTKPRRNETGVRRPPLAVMLPRILQLHKLREMVSMAHAAERPANGRLHPAFFETFTALHDRTVGQLQHDIDRFHPEDDLTDLTPFAVQVLDRDRTLIEFVTRQLACNNTRDVLRIVRQYVEARRTGEPPLLRNTNPGSSGASRGRMAQLEVQLNQVVADHIVANSGRPRHLLLLSLPYTDLATANLADDVQLAISQFVRYAGVNAPLQDMQVFVADPLVHEAIRDRHVGYLGTEDDLDGDVDVDETVQAANRLLADAQPLLPQARTQTWQLLQATAAALH